MSKQTGTVKFFNPEKRFGFIKPTDANQKDIFVHQNSVNGKIFEGDQVEFEVEKTDKGLSAINVTVIR